MCSSSALLSSALQAKIAAQINSRCEDKLVQNNNNWDDEVVLGITQKYEAMSEHLNTYQVPKIRLTAWLSDYNAKMEIAGSSQTRISDAVRLACADLRRAWQRHARYEHAHTRSQV